MTRYPNRPMDVADATLVHLAEREALSTVLTVDHADFETYRIGGRGGSEWSPGGERRGDGRRPRPRSSLVWQAAGAASRRWCAPDPAKSFGGGVLAGMPQGLGTVGPAREAMAKTEERW